MDKYLESVDALRIQQLDLLLSQMGGKSRWYQILEIQDSLPFFDENNIPGSIYDLLQPNEVSTYREMLKYKRKMVEYFYAIRPKIGDYVLGTKYPDGSTQDPWFIGFVVRLDYKSPNIEPTYVLSTHDGKIINQSFSKCMIISQALGQSILDQSDNLNDSTISIWEYITTLDSYRLND